MRFEFIAAQRLKYPLPVLCRVLEVSVSGYYAWRKRPVSQRTEANQALVAHIKAVHQASYETYGSPRIHAELVAQGYACGRHRIARLMRQHGLQAKQGHRRRFTTIRRAGDPVAPNLLDRPFQATAPNQKWLADITYIPTQEGDLYLAPILDLYARKIVGWANGHHAQERIGPASFTNGPAAAPTNGWVAASFRSWLPIHQPSLSTVVKEPPLSDQYEPDR
jgi:transposase InsO family protein